MIRMTNIILINLSRIKYVNVKQPEVFCSEGGARIPDLSIMSAAL